MIVEIINTGAELLLGRTLNTHQAWLCRRLSDLGHMVVRQTCVADVAPAISKAVQEALERADAVITTGGLGPTSDDLTRESIAGLLQRPLEEDPVVLNHIERIFRDRNRPVPARARLQAMIPQGAEVLANPAGTAPGLAIELDPNPHRVDRRRSLLIMLPGPPRELYPMFDQRVVPLLRRVFGDAEAFVCHTLRTTGVPESFVEKTLAAPLANLIKGGLEVGYCARPLEVDVRLTARGPLAQEAVEKGAELVRETLSDAVFSETDEELESVVVALLTKEKRTLAVAESCTGGLISHRLTNVPGASEVLLSGFVTYSNQAKHQCLDVPTNVLAEQGAVSEPAARAMAEGARRSTGADLAIAVTGIAGPSGGTAEKPVGTVYLALSSGRGTVVLLRQNRWDRMTFKQVTSQQGLDLIRRHLLNLAMK